MSLPKEHQFNHMYRRFFKKLIRFARDNYIISLFIAIVAFTLFVAAFKYVTAEKTYSYAKVKVSQGLWWASTNKPNIWLANAIKKGDTELSLGGKPLAEILSVRVYPWSLSDQYDIFLNVKLLVDKSSSRGTYTYKRSQLAVGSPVDFEFQNSQYSGTVLALSENPFEEKKSKKIITLYKAFAVPWEYEAIVVSDEYHDREEVVFKILDKKYIPSYSMYSSYGNNYAVESEPKITITVIAEVLVSEIDGMIVFGEEQILKQGSTMRITTPHYAFSNYYIEKIEEPEDVLN